MIGYPVLTKLAPERLNKHVCDHSSYTRHRSPESRRMVSGVLCTPSGSANVSPQKFCTTSLSPPPRTLHPPKFRNATSVTYSLTKTQTQHVKMTSQCQFRTPDTRDHCKVRVKETLKSCFHSH